MLRRTSQSYTWARSFGYALKELTVCISLQIRVREYGAKFESWGFAYFCWCSEHFYSLFYFDGHGHCLKRHYEAQASASLVQGPFGTRASSEDGSRDQGLAPGQQYCVFFCHGASWSVVYVSDLYILIYFVWCNFGSLSILSFIVHGGSWQVFW